MDVGDKFVSENKMDLALRVYTNITEIELNNPQYTRMLAYIMEKLNRIEDAISLYERIKKSR